MRKPRVLSFPPQEDTPKDFGPSATQTERPRRLLSDSVTPIVPEPARRIISPPQITPVEPQAVRERKIIAPPEIELQPSRTERPRNRTDDLIDRAKTIDPAVQPLRLRGRIDTLLHMSMIDVLDWGKRNLDPLQAASSLKAKIASEIARIDVTGWMERTKDASCKLPSLLDRFTAKSPDYYESMLIKTRSELLVFAKELEKMKGEFFREIADLHLDAISLMVCAEVYPDDQTKTMAQGRARTLLAAHQTAAMLQMTIEQSLDFCASSISQIDSLLSVTIPQWKMATQKP